MNRRGRQTSSSIPSLLDMPRGGGSSSGSYNTSSYGNSYSSPSSSGGLGLTAGLSLADTYNSQPMGYGSSSYGSSATSSLLASRNLGDGLLGDGLLGNGGGNTSYGGSGGSFGGSGGGGYGSILGGLTDDSFVAKVRLQQAMLAEEKQMSVQQQIQIPQQNYNLYEEKQMSVQQQIQEQLERQNAKRLDYNRRKREQNNRRQSDDRRNDNSRRDRRGSNDLVDDVQVTIKPRSEGRAVSDNTGGRKRNLSDRSRNQQGNQEAKKSASGDASTQGPWKCHVCVITCRDIKGYDLHMKGRKHGEAMERMREVTEYQAKQAVQRLQAERHHKRSSGRYRDDDDHYCRDCSKHYTGDLLAHRRTEQHKESRKTQRPHCRVCDVTFKTPKKYVAHCNTAGHKKVYEAAKKKGENVDEENFVTVDSVGECDDEECDDEALLAANLDGSKGDDNMQTDLGEGFDTKITVTNAGSEEDIVIIDEAQDPSAPNSHEYVSDALASSAEEDAIDDLVTAQLVSESDSMVTEDSSVSKPSDDACKKKKKKNEIHDEDLSQYDPNKPVGRHHVIPVWGYFCKPCRKFYQSVGSQGSVLDAHCKTFEHFEAMKSYAGKGEEGEDKEVDLLSDAIAQNQEMSV